MDADWFRQRMRALGVTGTAIGEALGRDRTVVSRLLARKQEMTIRQAQVFASFLEVPVDEVLSRAGIALDTGEPAMRGMSEEVARFDRDDARAPFVIPSGADVWRVNTAAMALAGLLPGDFVLVDGKAAARVASGDVVLAQVYDLRRGSARTILRRFQRPVLMSHSLDPDDWPVLVVDDQTVMVVGVVTASWRFSAGDDPARQEPARSMA